MEKYVLRDLPWEGLSVAHLPFNTVIPNYPIILMWGFRSSRRERGAENEPKGGLTTSEEPCRREKNEAEGQSEAGMQRPAADKPRKPACRKG
jgi:hypothetical protein